jgi:hypothetical protein
MCPRYCIPPVLHHEKRLAMLAYAPSYADCCDPSIMEEFYIKHWRSVSR